MRQASRPPLFCYNLLTFSVGSAILCVAKNRASEEYKVKEVKESKEYTISVEFEEPTHPIDQPIVKWGDQYVKIGITKEIEEKPMMLWYCLQTEQKESEIEISYFQAQIDRFVNLYGADINRWRNSIQTVLDNISTMLSEYDDLNKLTLNDFHLLVYMTEVEGQMLNGEGCVLMISSESNIVISTNLSGATAEDLVYKIRKLH